MLRYSPILKKACVIQVVLDKWLPPWESASFRGSLSGLAPTRRDTRLRTDVTWLMVLRRNKRALMITSMITVTLIRMAVISRDSNGADYIKTTATC